jgi:hypothetical protein
MSPGMPNGAAPAQPPLAETGDGGEQQRAGLSPRHQRAATLLSRLAATARSFLLYDAANDAVHGFLSMLLSSFLSALQEEGVLEFHVRPYEIVYEGEPVYLNRDMERSLAFRLYRDGVRMLRIRSGFDWEELAKLLEVLSARFTAVHQREDDAVTLLWKAAFRTVDVVAVEAIVPDEGEPTPVPALPGAPSGALDLPRPELPQPQAPSWVDVPDEASERLRAESAPASIPEEANALVQRLGALLVAPEARLRFAEVSHVFGEIRDFLLGEGHLRALVPFLGHLWRLANEDAPEWDPDRHSGVYDLLESCGDRQAVRRLLRATPSDERRLQPELIDVLDRVCPDPLVALADMLAEQQSLASRAIARQLLEHYGQRRIDVLEDRFREARGHVASDLLRVIAGIGGDSAVEFIASQRNHPDRAVQDEALWHLGHMPYSGTVGRSLFEIFRNAEADLRARAVGLIARSRDLRFVDAIARWLEENAGSVTTDEAAAVGRALGQIGGPLAISRIGPWLQPTGRLRKGLPGPLPRIIAAAAALAEVPGEQAAEALEAGLAAADDEARPWIARFAGERVRARGAEEE